MLRARTRLRIEKWILSGEIVKAALGNDFENRERFVAENSNSEFAPRNKFFDKQFAIVFRRLHNRLLKLFWLLHDEDAHCRTLARRLDHDR